jgi:hypothetical protein
MLKKYINLILKLGRTIVIMWKGLLTGSLSRLFCLKHLSCASFTSLRSGCQNRFILDPFHSNTLIIFVLFFQIVWTRIYETKFPTQVSFLFSVFICRITLTFPSMLKTFLLFVTVTMLACYQSPVNWMSRNVEGNFTHKVNYCYYCHFRPGIYVATWKHRGLVFWSTRRW